MELQTEMEALKKHVRNSENYRLLRTIIPSGINGSSGRMPVLICAALIFFFSRTAIGDILAGLLAIGATAAVALSVFVIDRHLSQSQAPKVRLKPPRPQDIADLQDLWSAAEAARDTTEGLSRAATEAAERIAMSASRKRYEPVRKPVEDFIAAYQPEPSDYMTVTFHMVGSHIYLVDFDQKSRDPFFPSGVGRTLTWARGDDE